MKEGVSTLRRIIIAAIVLVILAAAWSAWLAWRTERDLRRADDAVERLQAAVESGDDKARDAAVADLQDAASSATGRTDGLWWAAMTKMPVYGDDAAGVEALSASVDLVATEAVVPLVDTANSLDGLVADGRIDPVRVSALSDPIDRAASAMNKAAALVEAEDSDGFVSALKTRYDDYADRVGGYARNFGAAQTAVDVLPGMLGSDGPRDYLFIFQNNAEIRSTGGLPGSWAQIHVEDGNIELRKQGSASDLNEATPALTLTDEELAVYDELPALFFQDPNFIPDFPRAAQIFDAFWSRKYPAIELDGVLALDPVGMSFLMAGTGPVEVGDLSLTPDNIVSELLSNTYLTITDPAKQDRRFQQVARAIFSASTTQLDSPIDFVEGVSRAIEERRFLVAPFDSEEAERLSDAPVLGSLSGDDGSTPHVDVGVNDATGSKMSFYLRHRATVEATSCADGVQTLEGRMTLSQTIGPRDAMALPDYVTGGAAFGIPVGSQLVTLRLYGPFGGKIADVRLDGEPLLPEYGLMIDGRPVVTVGILIETLEDSLVTWDMRTGAGQVGDGRVSLTPSIVPGTSDNSFRAAC